VIFTIKQGQHYSDQLLYKMFNCINNMDRLCFDVTFTNSCAYSLPHEDQEDINKLFGFSNGLHHNNSARFGWYYLNNKIQLWAYFYNNKQRKSTHITSLELNKPYQLCLIAHNDYYEFIVESDYAVVALIEVPKTTKNKLGYKLWPYFGGNNTSPQDIYIHMTHTYL